MIDSGDFRHINDQCVYGQKGGKQENRFGPDSKKQVQQQENGQRQKHRAQHVFFQIHRKISGNLACLAVHGGIGDTVVFAVGHKPNRVHNPVRRIAIGVKGIGHGKIIFIHGEF